MAGLIGTQWRQYLQRALDDLASVQTSHLGDSALFSAERQLKYLLSLADERDGDDGKLEEINLGYLAMYQLSDIISPDLAEIFSDVNERVRRHLRRQGRRLRIDER